jgi:hypothetical protein
MGRRWAAGCVLTGVAFVTAASGSPARAAQRLDDGDRPYWRTNLFKRVFTDQKFLLTRWWPEEIKHDKAFDATLVTGVVFAIQSGSHGSGGQDLDWEGEISGGSRRGVQSVSHDLTRLGNGPVVAAILGITYLSARRAHDDRLAEASSLAAESLLDAGIWIAVLKTATARVRPNQTDGGRFLQYGSAQNGSFPSGHAMAAFSVASVFANRYRDKKWVPWLSYGVATLIGGARLALGRHFPSDVVVGAVLGTSIGRGVVARSSEDGPPERGTFGATVGPDGRGMGIGWRYSWK